jgi:hypothetical protein
VVRVPRRVFQRLLPERPTPERCVEAYYLQRTRFEHPRRDKGNANWLGKIEAGWQIFRPRQVLLRRVGMRRDGLLDFRPQRRWQRAPMVQRPTVNSTPARAATRQTAS